VAAEHEPVAAPAAAPPVATPEAAAPAPAFGAAAILSLQRTAGNQAVSRAIADGRIARDAKQVSVTGVSVSPSQFSVPVESGVKVKATAAPANATGITWALKDGTATVTGSTIDDKGVITFGASQPGGSLLAEATADDGSSADRSFNMVGDPGSIASSTGAATGTYAADFVHTFSGGTAAAGANVNEKFDATSVKTDFGDFTLKKNAAGSHGWDLDATGKMTGPDNVSIDQSMIDANKFVKTASNPSPAKSLPVGFSMTQHFTAKSFPSGKMGTTDVTTTEHVRNLEDRGGLKVVLKAGAGEVPIDYAGPPIYRNAKADNTSIPASPPKPATGEWKRGSVQVSVTVEPSGTPKYSFVGDALGCEVDGSGKVLIGSTPGTITVRAGDGDKHYDEVQITITPPPAPAADAGAPKSDSGGSGESMAATPDDAGS